MRPPTANPITQKEHSIYKAVDYSGRPDLTIYAPEDGEIVFYELNGTAGLQIRMQGANGRHGFAHTSPLARVVKVGDKVKKGDPIGIMGYTGLTVPAGPLGTHLHWTLLSPDGTYVYPPSKVTEPFGGEDDMYPTEPELQAITAQTGWQKGGDGKTSPNAIAYWVYGTGNPFWSDPVKVRIELGNELFYTGRKEGQEMNPGFTITAKPGDIIKVEK